MSTQYLDSGDEVVDVPPYNWTAGTRCWISSQYLDSGAEVLDVRPKNCN
jgi:hypothetical protein